MAIALVQAGVEDQSSGAVHVVGAVDALGNGVVDDGGVIAGFLSSQKLSDGGKDFEIDFNFFFKQIVFENVNSAGVIVGKQFGNEAETFSSALKMSNKTQF